MAFTTDYQHGNYASAVDHANLKAFVWNVTTGKVIQNFKGETAWMDAQRKVIDLDSLTCTADPPSHLRTALKESGAPTRRVGGRGLVPCPPPSSAHPRHVFPARHSVHPSCKKSPHAPCRCPCQPQTQN